MAKKQKSPQTATVKSVRKTMENGTLNRKDWVTSKEAQKLLGYGTSSGVQRFFKKQRVPVKKVPRTGGWGDNLYPRDVVMSLKHGKKGFAATAVGTIPVDNVESVAESAEAFAAEGSSQNDQMGDEWVTIAQARSILHFASESGTRDYLRRSKLVYRTITSSRGRPDMRLYRRTDVEAYAKKVPPRSDGGHRKAFEAAGLARLNEHLAGENTTSRDEVLDAIRTLFATHPRLVEVTANRETGEVRVVLVSEARL